MKTYRTATSDEDIFHVFESDNDDFAERDAYDLCAIDSVELWNLEELDEDYNVIRSVFQVPSNANYRQYC